VPAAHRTVATDLRLAAGLQLLIQWAAHGQAAAVENVSIDWTLAKIEDLGRNQGRLGNTKLGSR
jgi:hypothetical protein